MTEDLKGTVLHFYSHHLYLFSEFRQVTKYYWRLEQYWSHLKNSSNTSSVSNSLVPHCLSEDKEFGERKILNQKLCDYIENLEKLFLTHSTPLSGFIADFPAHWNVLGSVPLPLISADCVCSALLRSVYSLLLRLGWAGSLPDCSRLTNFWCWNGFVWNTF